MLKNFKWASGQTLTPFGLERVFQRSSQAVGSPLAAKMSNLPPRCPAATYSTGNAYSAKNDVEGLPCAGKNSLQVPMDSREGSIDALGPKTRICQWRTGRLHSNFAVNCSTPGPSWWPTQGSEASTLSGLSLIQFVANAASSCILRWAMSRKALISANCRY